MAHVINSGWVDSLPRHLLRSPPLARVGVSTLVPTTPPTDNGPSLHTILPTCSKGRRDRGREEAAGSWRTMACQVNDRHKLIYITKGHPAVFAFELGVAGPAVIFRGTSSLSFKLAHTRFSSRGKASVWAGRDVKGKGVYMYACVCKYSSPHSWHHLLFSLFLNHNDLWYCLGVYLNHIWG